MVRDPAFCKKENSIKSNERRYITESASTYVPVAKEDQWGPVLIVLASSDTLVINAFGDQPLAAHRGGANSALRMHTRKGINTQRSDGGEESQGLHSEETIDGWK
ncbi:hypothetical protein BDN67DRAFT_962732 [Paxillus ammoniavirescens]|nr:hypothetical protein BDN67DRAFT_962732 [Paxillus ammoniavirescens]